MYKSGGAEPLPSGSDIIGAADIAKNPNIFISRQIALWPNPPSSRL